MSFMYVAVVSIIMLSTAVIFSESINIGWKNIVLTLAGFVVNIGALYVLNVDLNPTLKFTKEEAADESREQTTKFESPNNTQNHIIRRDSKSVDFTVTGHDATTSADDAKTAGRSNSCFSFEDEKTISRKQHDGRDIKGCENGGFSLAESEIHSSHINQETVFSRDSDTVSSSGSSSHADTAETDFGNFNNDLSSNLDRNKSDELPNDKYVVSDNLVHRMKQNIKEDSNLSVVYVENLYPA